MKIFNLVDRYFSHIEYSAPGISSELMKWDRTGLNGEVSFYTHDMIYKCTTMMTEKNYGLLIESQAIVPEVYQIIINNPYLIELQYNTIFSHSSKLIERGAKWIPGGSIWVGGSYGGGEIKLYEKTKNCSIVSSDKRICPLHNFRIAVTELLQDRHDVDIYGTLTGEWVPIIDTLKDYCFSIVIENFIDDEYFTEKLLNCFATGTIPIYMGARNLSKHFNIDGVLQFEKPKELLYILDYINQYEYSHRYKAVIENFERCKKFRLLEDYIVTNYFSEK